LAVISYAVVVGEIVHNWTNN